MQVQRARAEELRTRRGTVDVVTARAVAPLGRLAGWALPLLRPGGALLALKGSSAAVEVAEQRDEVERYGCRARSRCSAVGVGVVDPPTTVVRVVEGERAVSWQVIDGSDRPGHDSGPQPNDVSRETEPDDTPIARAAATAVQVLTGQAGDPAAARARRG